MERLTEEKQIGPWASLKDKAEAKVGAFADYDCLMAHMTAVTRLKYYEDLEEQGRLVVLPCKVGDTVYRKLTLTYQKETVTVIGIDNEGIYIGTTCGTYQKHHLGKTVFLTCEEAENALKEDA